MRATLAQRARVAASTRLVGSHSRARRAPDERDRRLPRVGADRRHDRRRGARRRRRARPHRARARVGDARRADPHAGPAGGGDLELAAGRDGARPRRCSAWPRRRVGVAAMGGLAWLFARRPGFFGVLALAALPFRVPVQAGGSTANLLVPLYVVIGAGALAWLIPRLAARHAGTPRRARGLARVGAAGRHRALRRAVDLRRRPREGVRAGDLLLRPVRAAVRAAARDGVDAAAAGVGRRRAGRARADLHRRSASGSSRRATCC